MKDDIRTKIKHIEIFTKRLVATTLSGDYLSAFKGSGIEFNQLREYLPGDDVRLLHWNSYVKTNKLMVKEFVEERDRTIILMVDVSSSGMYSSKLELKEELVATVASALALIASESNDRVGAIFFSDRVEKWVAPSRGRAHVNKILETILTLEPEGSKTSISEALKFLISLKKRNAVVFMLSDFIDDTSKYSNLLKLTSCKHDFIGIRVLDACEQELPDIGFVEIKDPETSEHMILNTSGLSSFLVERKRKLVELFNKYRVDLLDLTTDKPFTGELVKFFHKRIRRSI